MFSSCIEQPFFIALNSQNTSGEYDLHPDNLKLMLEMNKNMLYYYFCINIKDFVFHSIDRKGLLVYASLPKYLCFKTYYPSLEFYENVFRDITGELSLTESTSRSRES
jgi:hypothetical protein